MEWKIEWLSQNPSITFKDVLDHPEIQWDMDWVSCNPSITIKDVLSHPKLKWDISSLSFNPSITMRDVLDNPKIRFNISGLSTNPSITMRDILKHPTLKWDWLCISLNPSITFLDILKNPNMKWQRKYFSKKDYNKDPSVMQSWFVNIIIGLIGLELPVYILLWIIDKMSIFNPPSESIHRRLGQTSCIAYDYIKTGMNELKKIRIIERIQKSYKYRINGLGWNDAES